MINYRTTYRDIHGKILEINTGELADSGEINLDVDNCTSITIEWRADGNNRIHELSPD